MSSREEDWQPGFTPQLRQPAQGMPLPGPAPGRGLPEVWHWALASVALGAVFVLIAPPALLLALWLEVSGYKGFSPSDKTLAAVGGYASVALILALVAVGVAWGVRGAQAARRQGQPSVLALCGILLNALAAALWVGAGVAWHSQAWRFLK
jgi:hypothetical protein